MKLKFLMGHHNPRSPTVSSEEHPSSSSSRVPLAIGTAPTGVENGHIVRPTLRGPRNTRTPSIKWTPA